MPGFGVDRGSGASTGNADSPIAESLIDAKGDLIAGLADNEAARLAVGTDNQRLVADSSQATGLKYVADTQNTVADAKGDLIVGTAADTVAKLTVGANETRLVAASGEATGLKYVADTTNYAVAAKGDLLAGTAADTVAPLTVGTDDQALLADSSQSTGMRWGGVPSATVRQTQLIGPLDSSGYNATISAGAGLNFNVDASPSPVVYCFANGFGVGGAVDTYTQLSADASNQGTLLASNTHYLHATRVSASSVTWGQSLIPPQYGYAFDRTQGALLNFEGSDASTTIVDDFGNTWTASGNAQIDTAQFKFGASSLLLDGTGDYATSTNFTTLGDGSWEISGWFRLNATSAFHVIFAAENSAGFGVVLMLDHNAGSRRLRFDLSSDGSTNNIGAPTGTTTTLALATWYKYRAVFDALAGTYRLYLSNNGAAESQELSVSSTARICALDKLRIGNSVRAGFVDFNGWIDAFRFVRCATATAAETPSASAPAITDYPVHFFSIPAMTMYEATAASASAGVNPTLTQKNRVFVAEADTNGASVTAVRNYALRGEYVGQAAAAPGVSTSTAASHNIGVPPRNVKITHICATASSGYVSGDEVSNLDSANGTYGVPFVIRTTRNSMSFAVENSVAVQGTPAAGGASAGFTTASWRYRLSASRGW